MEFNFNSYDTSKQSILYCEIDKCKTVIKYKQAIEKIEQYCKANRYSGWVDVEGIIQICDEVNE